jgi:hypothetical protein
MSAPKGNCFNPSGRPKGSKSKKTQQWEYFVEYCMAEGCEKFTRELEDLKGKEYVQAFLSLMEFFKPKLSRVNSSSVTHFTMNDLIEELDVLKKR